MKNDFLRSITVENFEKIYIETIKFFEPKGDINVKNKDIYVNFAKMIIKFVTILDRNKEADLPQSSNIYIAATLKKCRDDLIKIQTIY